MTLQTSLLFANQGRPSSKVTDDPLVVFFGQPAQELEHDDHQHDADAGGGEGAARGDLPGLVEEAGIDGVPVPEHLVGINC